MARSKTFKGAVALSVAGVIERTPQAAETIRSGNRPTTDFTAYDLILFHGGQDKEMDVAARDLVDKAASIREAVESDVALLAVCAGYQLLGMEFGGENGQPLPGLEILNIRSGRGQRRGVGEILADVDPSLGVPRLTGFENHQGMTRLGPGVAPLARVAAGVGNGDGTEGAFAGRVLGTYLHGPVLVRNPGLADLLLTWAVGALPPLPAGDEEWTQRLREQRLAAAPAGPEGPG